MLQSFSMLNDLICVLFQSLQLARLGAILFFLIITKSVQFCTHFADKNICAFFDKKYLLFGNVNFGLIIDEEKLKLNKQHSKGEGNCFS